MPETKNGFTSVYLAVVVPSEMGYFIFVLNSAGEEFIGIVRSRGIMF